MADSLEPYAGGLVGPAGGQYVAVGAKESLRLWAVIDQCTPALTGYRRIVFQPAAPAAARTP